MVNNWEDYIKVQAFIIMCTFTWTLPYYRAGENCCKFRSPNQKSNGMLNLF